jgi:hypothetical protein
MRHEDITIGSIAQMPTRSPQFSDPRRQSERRVVDSVPVCAQERHPEPDVCADQEDSRRVGRETGLGRQNGIVRSSPRRSPDSINPYADDDGTGVVAEAWSDQERKVVNGRRFYAAPGVRAAGADADGDAIGRGPRTGESS